MLYDGYQGFPYNQALVHSDWVTQFGKQAASMTLVALAFGIAFSTLRGWFFQSIHIPAVENDALFNSLARWSENQHSREVYGERDQRALGSLHQTPLAGLAGLHIQVFFHKHHFTLQLGERMSGTQFFKIRVLGFAPLQALDKFLRDVIEQCPYMSVKYLVQRADGSCTWRHQLATKRDPALVDLWLSADERIGLVNDVIDFYRREVRCGDLGLPFSRLLLIRGDCDSDAIAHMLARALDADLYVYQVDPSYGLPWLHELHGAVHSLRPRSFVHLKILAELGEDDALEPAVEAAVRAFIVTLKSIHGCVVLVTGGLNRVSTWKHLADRVLDVSPASMERILAWVDTRCINLSSDDRSTVAALLVAKLRERSLSVEEMLAVVSRDGFTPQDLRGDLRESKEESLF